MSDAKYKEMFAVSLDAFVSIILVSYNPLYYNKNNVPISKFNKFIDLLYDFTESSEGKVVLLNLRDRLELLRSSEFSGDKSGDRYRKFRTGTRSLLKKWQTLELGEE